jgi:hypothetical protein
MSRRSERLMKKMVSIHKPEEQPLQIQVQIPKEKPAPSSNIITEQQQVNQFQTRNPTEWLQNYIHFTDQAVGAERNFRLFQLFQIVLMEYPDLLTQSQPFYTAFLNKLRDFRVVAPQMFEQLSIVLPSIILLDM